MIVPSIIIITTAHSRRLQTSHRDPAAQHRALTNTRMCALTSPLPHVPTPSRPHALTPSRPHASTPPLPPPHSIHDLFVAKLTEAAKGIVMGHGMDAGVAQGPLINGAGRTKVKQF